VIFLGCGIAGDDDFPFGGFEQFDLIGNLELASPIGDATAGDEALPGFDALNEGIPIYQNMVREGWAAAFVGAYELNLPPGGETDCLNDAVIARAEETFKLKDS